MKTIKIKNDSTEIPVGKIICLGRNYQEHAKEMKSEVPTEPILFLKPSTAIVYNQQNIIIPKISTQPYHEVELIVVIGKNGRHITANSAYDYILGYGVGLDMTLRDIQNEAKNKGLPWSVAKGFDTSAPISEVVHAYLINDPHNLIIQCTVNGEVRQRSSTNKMIFTIDKIIEYISSIFTLEKGDIIFTGTPEGVGVVKDGDVIEAELVGYTKTTHSVKFE